MHDAQGVGLAATQVGVLRRVFVFEPDEDGPRVVVNPTIVDAAATSSSPTTRAASRCRACASRSSVATTLTIDGQGPERRGRQLRARGLRGARRAARARPSRRGADHRPHRRRAPQGSARHVAAPRHVAVRIGVAATAPIGADVLERLAERHEIAFLLTRPDAPRGRGRKLAAPPAAEAAVRLGIPVHQPEKPELPGRGRAHGRLRVRALHPAAPARAVAVAERAPVAAAALARRRAGRARDSRRRRGDRRDDPPDGRRARRRPDRRAGGVRGRRARRGRGVRARRRDRGPPARRSARRRRRSSRRRTRASPTPRRSRRPTASSTSPTRSTPGGACGRSRRTSARGRCCTDAASRSGARSSRTARSSPTSSSPRARRRMSYDEFLRGVR